MGKKNRTKKSKKTTKKITPEAIDVIKTNSKRDEKHQEEEMKEEEIGQEWWDRNMVWHTRSPYVTGALMDKLEPYIQKLKTTPAWQAYDKYLRSIGPFTEEIDLETRWKIAKKWYEREDPKGFLDKLYKEEKKDEPMKKLEKGRRKKYLKIITTE